MGGDRKEDEDRNSGGKARKSEKDRIYFTLPKFSK